MSTQQVDNWFRSFEHPLKNTMLRVRDIILKADSRMDECIKWSSPTFTYEGNLASFNPRAKAHVSLMFHTGATIPGDHPLLQGGGGTARYMTFADISEAEARRGALQAVVRSWIESKSGGSSAAKTATPVEANTAAKAAPAEKKTTAKKTTAKKKAAPKKKKAAPGKTASKKKASTASKKKTKKKVVKKAAKKKVTKKKIAKKKSTSKKTAAKKKTVKKKAPAAKKKAVRRR